MAFERLTLSVMAASLIGLAACQQPLPNQSNNQTRQGALIGAGIGAVDGAIGASLDRQEAELRQELGSGTITNTGSQLIVTLPQDILFGVDSASVGIQSQSDLAAVARSLNNYPNTTVNVVGHTDNTGDAAYNQDLSERRAQAVAQVLAASGVSPARIATIGRGEDAPIASNQSAEGRQQNRRVEIIITPNQ